MSCILLIRDSMDGFTETEARLARFILERRQDVTRMNTRQFADGSGTSPAAVVRFSQKLGFSGFNDLKLDLAREPEAHAEDFQAVIKESDSLDAIVRKASAIYARSVEDTYRMVNISLLNQAVDALCQSRRISLYGVGASGLLAMDFQDKLARLGFTVSYYGDTHTSLTTAALLEPGDLAVAISYSGETQETLLAAQTARRRGCRVLSITRPGRSRLVKCSDFPLFIPGDEQELRVGAMTSRISGLLVLDLLYLGVASRDFTRTEDCLQETRAIIKELRGIQ